MTFLEATIRHQLGVYLSDHTSLDAFTAWLVSATWNVANRGEAEASELTFAIELALAEHASGLLTLDELRAELRRLSQEGPHHPITP